MTAARDRREPHGRLSRAIVLSTTEETCTVFAGDQRTTVPFATPFPRPRTERVAPGHLGAIATASEGDQFVAWRWFDAVVVDEAGTSVELWEPGHGVVLADRRDPQQSYRPGSRAYLSAGLPGAKWWVAGPAVERAEDADVELDEVERFLTGFGLWPA